jgi:transcriptional regulator with XRE-family HTH domain
MADNKIHHGRNIKRFRELFGIKQEALALELGDDWNQQRISLLEQKEEIADNILEEVAKALKVPVEAIKNFDKEAALNFIGNTFTSHDNSATLNGYTINYSPNFNPIEKWMEALEQNKQLYERLLQTEREKVELLERMLKEKPF